jgi:hypothetical protein
MNRSRVFDQAGDHERDGGEQRRAQGHLQRHGAHRPRAPGDTHVEQQRQEVDDQRLRHSTHPGGDRLPQRQRRTGRRADDELPEKQQFG